MSSRSEGSSVASAGSAGSNGERVSHYNDWPNSQGFDVHYEEHKPIELTVKGEIPPYAAGVLFRTSIGPRDVYNKATGERKYRANHWFDAMSQVHRFQIHAPSSPSDKVKVTYNSRLTSDGLIERIQNGGKLETFTFGAKYDPCKSVFSKVSALFTPDVQVTGPNENNNAVTMSVNYPGLTSTGTTLNGSHNASEVVTLCNKTDTSRIQMLDPNTLEPIGIARQTVLHPELTGVLSAAHAKSDPITGDVFNFNLDIFGRKSSYRVFRTSASTGETCILATIKHNPAYLHSFFITEHYLVLCIWSSYFRAGGTSILYNKNLVDAMYTSKDKATWYVIDKRDPAHGGQGVVSTHESDPFFAFHTVNAYEEPNTSDKALIDIIADVPTWPDMEVVRLFLLDNMMSNKAQAHDAAQRQLVSRPQLTRHRLTVSRLSSSNTTTTSKQFASTSLPRSPVIIDFKLDPQHSMELPTLNFTRVTHKYKYIYGIQFGDGTKSTFVDGLIKLNLDTRETLIWQEKGQTPGEAIFVPNPNPNSTDANEDTEDDGVLLTVVLDGHTSNSYLLVLDAKTFKEIGRADVPGTVGFGFHGLFTKLATTAATVTDTKDTNATENVVGKEGVNGMTVRPAVEVMY